MSFDERLPERIAREFTDADRTAVGELLTHYSGPEPDRVRWDILELSKGSLEKVRLYLRSAQTDYRDVLYWAEYYDNDPMLQGRDPKKMVEDILVKWGNPNYQDP